MQQRRLGGRTPSVRATVLTVACVAICTGPGCVPGESPGGTDILHDLGLPVEGAAGTPTGASPTAQSDSSGVNDSTPVSPGGTEETGGGDPGGPLPPEFPDSGSDSDAQLVVTPGQLALTSSEPASQLSVQVIGSKQRAYYATPGQPWLSVSPDVGESAGETDSIAVTADPTDLTPGTHAGQIAIVTTDGLEQVVAVSFSVDAGAPDPPRVPPTVAGQVLYAGSALPDILIYVDGSARTVTNSAGAFEVVVPVGWSGTVTPVDINYEFDPPELTFDNLEADSLDNGVDAARLPPVVPNIGVRRASDARLFEYQGPPIEGPIGPDFEYVAVFDTAVVDAELRWLGNDQWQFTLTPRVEVADVWFPLERQEQVLGDDSADDVFFGPALFGYAIQSDAMDANLRGPLYPGAFAPLFVHADPTHARMFAAVNWPPKTVTPLAARGRMAMLYRDGDVDVPAVGETYTYGLIQTQASGDREIGVYAWQRVLDKYKHWLNAEGTAAGLFPTEHSQWMRDIESFVIVQLTGLPDEDVSGYLNYYWDNWGQLFPWMQMWGQMSDYNPGEDCCLEGPEIHPRYLPALTDFAELATGDGGRIGYYARVEDSNPPIDGSTPESEAALQNLVDWMDYNSAHGANVHYIDVLGAMYYGDPLTIAEYFGTVFPIDTLIEYAVDVYPTAFLIANAIYGNGDYGFGPDYTDCIDCFDEDEYRVTFPRFGRYLLDDRMVFLGSINGGHIYWGADSDHWQERQVFLLGAKFVLHCGGIEDVLYSGEMNVALERIFAEWARVEWWKRNPAYRDRSGVYDVPELVEVRRFVDKDGVNLFVIDNWYGQVGATFMFQGQPVEIPPEQLSIVELP